MWQKLKKEIQFLPNYVTFALDERGVSTFYFQLYSLQQPACFSQWLSPHLSSWAQLTQDPSLRFVPGSSLCCQVPAALVLLLNFTVKLCLCNQNRALNSRNSVFLTWWSLGEMLRNRLRSSVMQPRESRRICKTETLSSPSQLFPSAISAPHLPAFSLTKYLFLMAKAVQSKPGINTFPSQVWGELHEWCELAAAFVTTFMSCHSVWAAVERINGV